MFVHSEYSAVKTNQSKKSEVSVVKSNLSYGNSTFENKQDEESASHFKGSLLSCRDEASLKKERP